MGAFASRILWGMDDQDILAVNVQLSDKAKLPLLGTKGAAGYDLSASEDGTLLSGVPTKIPTGVRLEMPAFLVAFVRGRSGLASKGIRVFEGTIDSDYRGEVSVLVTNDTASDFKVSAGHRIAQIVFLPIARPDLVKVQELGKTNRGEGGFGSTGVAISESRNA